MKNIPEFRTGNLFLNELFSKQCFPSHFQPTRKQYRKVFLIAAAISLVGGLFYGAFVSGKQQQWNDFNQTTTLDVHGDRTEDEEDVYEGDLGSILTSDREYLING